MSATPAKDDVFFQLVTRFLEEANKLNEEHQRSRVSAALLSAASRYNAFTWLKRDPALMAGQTEEEAAQFFAEHYKAMFRENLEYLKSLK